MPDGPRHSLIKYIQRIAHQEQFRVLDDAELVAQFAGERSEAAFEALVWRHGPLVWSVCRRYLPNEHDAEDAFQATFLALARAAGSVKRWSSVSGWLHKVATRIARKAQRNALKRTAQERPILVEPFASSTDDILWRDLGPVLDEEVSRLPERYRLPFTLCDRQGKSLAAAALEIGCPRGTVSTRLTKARKLLRANLARRGITLSATGLASVVSREASSASLPMTLVHSALRYARVGGTANGTEIPQAVAVLADGAFRSGLNGRLWVSALLVLIAAAGAAGMGLKSRDKSSKQPLVSPAELELQASASPLRLPSQELDQPILPDALPAPISPSLPLEHANAVTDVAFNANGSELVTKEPEYLHFWDAKTGAEHRRIKLPWKPSDEIVISPDGRWIAFCCESVRIWDCAAENIAYEINLDTGRGRTRVTSEMFAFAPDSKTWILSAFTTRFGDVSTGKEFKEWKNFFSSKIVLSPDGKTIASGMRNGTALIDIATGVRLHEFPNERNPPLGIAFSPDGKWLALSDLQVPPDEQCRIRVWDAKSGRLHRQFQESQSLKYGKTAKPLFKWLAFVRGGTALAGLGHDGSCWVWDLDSQDTLCKFFLDGGIPVGNGIGRASFSPDGQYLAWAGRRDGDRMVHLTDIATGLELHPDGITPLSKLKQLSTSAKN
jgi:RNA polymerase sigma factor (sigma-70 family)